MMARSHLLAGSALVVAASSTVLMLGDAGRRIPGALDDLTWSLTGSDVAVSSWFSALGHWAWPGDTSSAPGLLMMVAAPLLFWLGCLLPDIDSSTSKLGRHVPTPGPHHGISHTDFVVWALLLVSMLEPTRVLLWLTLGYWSHLELDGLSRAGRVRFYPLTKYRVVDLPGGERLVVRPRWRGLYRVGKPSETRVLAGVLVVCAVVTAAAVLV